CSSCALSNLLDSDVADKLRSSREPLLSRTAFVDAFEQAVTSCEDAASGTRPGFQRHALARTQEPSQRLRSGQADERGHGFLVRPVAAKDRALLTDELHDRGRRKRNRALPARASS